MNKSEALEILADIANAAIELRDESRPNKHLAISRWNGVAKDAHYHRNNLCATVGEEEAARENGVTMANIEREVSSRAEIDRIVERLRREGIEVADPSRSLAGRALAGLPTSVLSALGKKGVKTWGDLFQKTEEDLWKVCPPATVAEIQALVPRTGFRLGMSLEEVWTRSRELTEIFAIPLNGLDLSVRSANALHMNDIFTLGEVCAKTKDQILLLRNVGVSSLAEIESMVQSYGLSLGMIVPGLSSTIPA